MVQRQLLPPDHPGMLGAPSPDGRFLSYTDRRTGNLAIVELPTNSVRLLTSDGNLSGPDYASVSTFSGDSRSIAYAWFSHACQCAQLRTISVDGGRPTIITTFTGVDEILPVSWSRDGKKVAAWISTPEGGLRLHAGNRRYRGTAAKSHRRRRGRAGEYFS